MISVNDGFLKEFQDILDDLSRIEYFTRYSGKKNINNVELFYIYVFLRVHQPEIVFESGVYHGRSSVIIAYALHINQKGQLISASLKKHPHILGYQSYVPFHVEYGRGEKVITQIRHDRSICIISDGPKPRPGIKGKSFRRLWKKSTQFPGLLAFFQHDLSNLRKYMIFKSVYKHHFRKRFVLDMMPKSFALQYKCLDNRFPGFSQLKNKYISNLGAYILRDKNENSPFS